MSGTMNVVPDEGNSAVNKARRRSRSHRKKRKRFYSQKPQKPNHEFNHRATSRNKKELQQLPFYNVHHKTYMRLVAYRPLSISVERYPRDDGKSKLDDIKPGENETKGDQIEEPTINESRGRIANLLDVFRSKMRLNMVCTKCESQAYDAESITANGRRFHMKCFKCESCKSPLQRSSWNQYNEIFLCNPCHKKTLFDSFSR